MEECLCVFQNVDLCQPSFGSGEENLKHVAAAAEEVFTSFTKIKSIPQY